MARDYAGVIEGLKAKKLEAGLPGPFSYILARDVVGPAVEPAGRGAMAHAGAPFGCAGEALAPRNRSRPMAEDAPPWGMSTPEDTVVLWLTPLLTNPEAGTGWPRP